MYKAISITVDENLLKKIDEYALANNMTRSYLMSYASDQFIKAKTIEPELKLVLENFASSLESLTKNVEAINAKN